MCITARLLMFYTYFLLKAEQLLEKYEQVPEVQKMLQKGVETLQSQVVCFNMGSILIKPVQRILKYPLMLNELIKVSKFKLQTSKINGLCSSLNSKKNASKFAIFV